MWDHVRILSWRRLWNFSKYLLSIWPALIILNNVLDHQVVERMICYVPFHILFNTLKFCVSFLYIIFLDHDLGLKCRVALMRRRDWINLLTFWNDVMLGDEIAQGSAKVIRYDLSWILVGLDVRAQLRIVGVGKLHPEMIYLTIFLVMIHCWVKGFVLSLGWADSS